MALNEKAISDMMVGEAFWWDDDDEKMINCPVRVCIWIDVKNDRCIYLYAFSRFSVHSCTTPEDVFVYTLKI